MYPYDSKSVWSQKRDVQDPDNNNSNNNNNNNDDDDILYTAAFPQSGSSSAGIRVISASDIRQASNTGEIPLLFSRSAVGSLIFPWKVKHR